MVCLQKSKKHCLTSLICSEVFLACILNWNLLILGISRASLLHGGFDPGAHILAPLSLNLSGILRFLSLSQDHLKSKIIHFRFAFDSKKCKTWVRFNVFIWIFSRPSSNPNETERKVGSVLVFLLICLAAKAMDLWEMSAPPQQVRRVRVLSFR